MHQNQWEQKQKDEIVQFLYDILDGNDWGDNCDNLSVKVEFKGKFVLSRIYVDRIIRGIPVHTLDTRQTNVLE